MQQVQDAGLRSAGSQHEHCLPSRTRPADDAASMSLSTDGVLKRRRVSPEVRALSSCASARCESAGGMRAIEVQALGAGA